jgi:hypothetical protein
MPWSTPFREPIRTLRAATYILKLPQADQEALEWQAAMRCLIQASEFSGPAEFARIGVLRALHRHVEQVFEPTRRDLRWGRRRLARDR